MKTLKAIGISRADESGFTVQKEKTQKDIPAGTYTAAEFADRWPDQYVALTLAGMPHEVSSLITIT